MQRQMDIELRDAVARRLAEVLRAGGIAVPERESYIRLGLLSGREAVIVSGELEMSEGDDRYLVPFSLHVVALPAREK